jgi:hypothetical protein
MFSRSNLGDCRLQIIERAKCRWGKNERRKETWLRSRERGLWLTLDHKSTMWELRSLSNDSFDRRLSQEEKTDEAKKTLKRLDVRVLRIETAYAEVCLLACVTRGKESGGSVRVFVVRSRRAHVTALARLSKASTDPSSNQRHAAISGSGNPACASGRRTQAAITNG